MSFDDCKSSFQVDFPKNVVFACASTALKNNKLFEVREIDSVMHTITLSAGMSLFSWGENIRIVIKGNDSNTTDIFIESAPNRMSVFGGGFDMGKNRKNIEDVMKCISAALQDQANSSAAATPPPPGCSPEATDNQAFEFICPFCNTSLECPPELEDTICNCPECNQEICPSRN